MAETVTINDITLDRSEVSVLVKDPVKVTVYFDTGDTLVFEGPDAEDVWQEFDEEL